VRGEVTGCFWDIQTSRQTGSAGGTGKTTAEMQTARTFLDAGWDFVGETANGSEDIWKISEGLGYPRLSWEKYSGGTGEPNDPYQIATAEDLMSLGETPTDYGKHFILMADIDLSGFDGKDGRPAFNAIAPGKLGCHGALYGCYPTGVPFEGVFDGNGHAILNFTFASSDAANNCIGLFGYIDGRNAQIKDLVLIDPNVTQGDVVPRRGSVGCLVGWLSGGTISGCCVQGGSAWGVGEVGGVVGSTGVYLGARGWSRSGGTISNSYASVSVNGNDSVGGLVGGNGNATLTQCYSTGAVSGNSSVGGLVGSGRSQDVTECFWDTQTSRQTGSAGGTGKTTAEMQTAKTFLDAGWDFVGETSNGTEDIWWILEGKDYPRLWWEAAEQ
jgi:hypothetical protein